jgi:enoyl-CoA hydratase/carnithine racemase
MTTLEWQDSIAVLNLGSGDNRFSPEDLDELEDALNQIESMGGPVALVTCADGHIWHNGLDLDWLKGHPDALEPYVARIQHVLGRFAGAAFPTVAAVSGHAFGAGAMLVAAHDRSIMRVDRGYWCLPEVSLGLSFRAGMVALLRSRLPVRTAYEAMTTGRRYSAQDAVSAGIIDQMSTSDAILSDSIGVARSLASTATGQLGTIKRVILGDTLRLLGA